METKIELFLSLSDLELLTRALGYYHVKCLDSHALGDASASSRIKTYLNRQKSYFTSK